MIPLFEDLKYNCSDNTYCETIARQSKERGRLPRIAFSNQRDMERIYNYDLWFPKPNEKSYGSWLPKSNEENINWKEVIFKMINLEVVQRLDLYWKDPDPESDDWLEVVDANWIDYITKEEIEIL